MNIYDFNVLNINDEEVSLEKYRNKVLLIVNTAPKCGFAPQYRTLEELYNKYHERGLEILNFPSNQFMKQAPGSNEDLKKTCELTFGTTYDIYAKIKVNGKNADPLYKYLKKQAPKDLKPSGKQDGFFRHLIFGSKIKWNFTKFLVNRKGEVVKRFSPGYKPEEIDKYIEELL